MSQPTARTIYPQATPNSALEIPALLSNTFSVTVNATFARISFGENIPGESPADAIYHTSICIPSAQLKTLADTILETIKRQKENEERSARKKSSGG